MRIALLALLLGACSPAVTLAPHPPKAGCSLSDAEPLYSAGKMRRLLVRLDAHDAACPEEAERAWPWRVRALALVGRDDDTRALIARIRATASASPDARSAATEAEQELAAHGTKSGTELVADGIAAKSSDLRRARVLLDRAIVYLERETGGTLALEPPLRLHDPAEAVAFDRTGNRLAIGRGDLVDVVAVPSWKLVARFSMEGETVRSLAFSSDSSTLAAASGTHVSVFALADGKRLGTLDASAPIAFAGNAFFAGDRDGFRVFDAATFTEPRLVAPGAPFVVAAVSLDGQRAVFAKDRTLRIVDVASAATKTVETGAIVASLAFSPDGTALAVGERYSKYGLADDLIAGDVELFDVASGKKIGEAAAKRAVLSVAFSPDGRWLAGTGSLSTRVWPLERDKLGRLVAGEPRKIVGFQGATLAVAWHPDGKRVVSTSTDKTTRVWDLEVSELVHQFTTDDVEPAWSAAFSHDSRTFVVGAGPNAAYVYALDGHPPRRLPIVRDKADELLAPEARRDNAAVSCIGMDPTGQTVAFAAHDHVLHWFDRAGHAGAFVTSDEIRRVAFPRKDVVSVLYAKGPPDSFLLPAGTRLPRLAGSDDVRPLAFLPDGAKYLAREPLGHEYVADVLTGKMLWSDAFHTDALAVSNNRKVVFASSAAVHVEGTNVSVPATGENNLLAIDGQGTRFAVAETTGRVRWFSIQGPLLGTTTVHARPTSLSFAPDGSLLVTSVDGTSTVWSMVTNTRLVRVTTTDDGGAFVQGPTGAATLSGSMHDHVVCHVGALVFPFDLCEDALVTSQMEL